MTNYKPINVPVPPSRAGKLLASTLRGRFIAAVKRLIYIFSCEDEVPLSRGNILKNFIKENLKASGTIERKDTFGIPFLLRGVETAEVLCNYVGPNQSMVEAVIIANALDPDKTDATEVRSIFGTDTADLVQGLMTISKLYRKSSSMMNDNFRDLLLTLAKDIRVIIIMLADRVSLLRAINRHPAVEKVKDIALEAAYLYAPLAHRLGLYAIKSELEDLSLKYSARETYTEIAGKLNETKKEREEYIESFITPVKAKLEEAGLKFEIKGRTKSIFSIWNKMRKQHNDLQHIYDLFAIRVIIDCPLEREKRDCWLAYSIITDMFRPNPARMKDWISIPKSNGYESLHVTVYGPGERWVEVQIRSQRMDLVAEKGLAAHWKYKGIKSEHQLDSWMNNIRDILDTANSGPMDLIKNMRMDVYDKEVFVFSPKGDLYRLPLGASLLDFAFAIHTKLGCQCTGGRINGVNCKINRKLQSGDTVEVFSSAQQHPKRDWLNFAITSKARNKIRVALKENESRTSDIGKEKLLRRMKNRKIDFDEGIIGKTLKKFGFKTITDFYASIENGELDVNEVIDCYLEILQPENKSEDSQVRSASEFVLEQPVQESQDEKSEDILVIGQGVKGVSFKMAKCCNPIYGDEVFGFVSSEGAVKVHRMDCPNAKHLNSRFPYRLVNVRWSGSSGSMSQALISITGKDDINIITNITSIINKEKDTSLRNISVDSVDGVFQGNLVVGIKDVHSLDLLIKKLETIKGVKSVRRIK